MKIALYRDACYQSASNIVLEYRDRGNSTFVQMSEPVEVDLTPSPDAEERYRAARHLRIKAEIEKLQQSVA